MHSFQKFIVVSFPTNTPPLCRNKDMEISCESAVLALEQIDSKPSEN